jgi:outer membrane protein assembly factor BamB
MHVANRIALASLVLLALTTLGMADDIEAFWQAARDGDTDQIKRLLEAGVDVDAVTEFNCGAMYFAANRNQADVIRLLVEAGGDVNLRDTDYNFTPVQMAAWLGHTEATKALIDAGASPSDTIGSCFAAASNGHAETVKLILDELEFAPSQLNALWSTANSGGHQNVCALLVKLGAIPPEATESPAAEKSEATVVSAQSDFDFSTDRPLPIGRPANWPEFRGRYRHGIADGQHPPIAFDLAQKQNILWTRPVEGLGLSSPIIWDHKVYITTAASELTEQTVDDKGRGWIDAVSEDVPHEWKVLCIDLKNGKSIWERTATAGTPRSRRHWKASQANPTCATNGRYLIASFGSQGLFCFDMEGVLQWEKDLGALDSGWYIDSTFEWGFASSPIIYDDKVIIQCDVHGDSYVAAFAIEDGCELWKSGREELPSWSTPTIYRGPQNELILNASKAVCAYNPEDGQLLWEIRGNSTITVASPIAADDLIVATGGYKTPKPIYVVRPGARGDITPSSDAADQAEEEDADVDAPASTDDAMVWSQQTGGVYLVTPLLYQGALYLCNQSGVLSGYDPESGARLFKQRMPCGDITASPVAADGRIYFVGETGNVVVLQAGREYQELAISDLDEATLATPAISDGVIVFRTVKGLVAVGHPR